MTKFKKGDKLKGKIWDGTGTIKKVSRRSIAVKWDDEKEVSENHSHAFIQHNYELVNPRPVKSTGRKKPQKKANMQKVHKCLCTTPNWRDCKCKLAKSQKKAEKQKQTVKVTVPKSPRLKKGDTFIYTKEMNEAYKACRDNAYYGDVPHLIGKTLTVDSVMFMAYDRYTVKNEGCGWLCVTIDDHLPLGRELQLGYKKPVKQPKRTWTIDTTIKSSDGIKVMKSGIYLKTLSGIPYTFGLDEAKEIYSQLEEALLEHKKHFKS